MKQTQIAFVIVHYRNIPSTIQLVKSLVNQDNNDYQIKIVVVNNSELDEDKYHLKHTLPIECEHLEITNVRNEGYFRGVNTGLNFVKTGTYYVVICNNDIVFQKNFLTSLERKSYPKGTMIIYPNLISSTGKSENPRIENNLSLIKLIFYKLYYSNYILSRIATYTHILLKQLFYSTINRWHKMKEFSTPRKILLGSGACIILTYHYFDKYIDLPNEIFLFGEEALLAERVVRKNGATYYDEDLIVFHEEHKTVSQMSPRRYWKIQKISSKYFLSSLWYLYRAYK